MGGLKPIGSEKLQGTDKLSRILEIARYNEHTPKPVNEDKSVEYTKTLSDGHKYSIIKEKNGYVIKKSLNESTDFDYIDPMKNRKYYSSYSQAFKRLNLIAKEINVNEGYDKNVSLFEAADEATKYILKFGETKEQAPAPAAPAPAAPSPSPAPAPEPVAEPAPEEMPVDDVELDVDVEDNEGGDEEEKVTYKIIQKLTGKLAQKIREFNDDEDKEETMSSKDIKYVINSVLSALNLDDLEEDDLESIVNKLEGVEEEGDNEGGDEEMVDVDMETEEPVAPEGEVAEGEEDFEFDTEDPEGFADYLFSDIDEEIEVDTNEGAYMNKVEEMNENMFAESNLDKVLQGYFTINESEKRENKLKLSENKKNLINKIKVVSESVSQRIASTKLVSKFPNSKLIGKTNKHSLVFEVNNKQIRVSNEGQIL